MKNLVIAVAVVLMLSSTAWAGWYVGPTVGYAYYPAVPVYVYPAPVVVAAPQVVYAPVAAAGPVCDRGAGVGRSAGRSRSQQGLHPGASGAERYPSRPAVRRSTAAGGRQTDADGWGRQLYGRPQAVIVEVESPSFRPSTTAIRPATTFRRR